MYKSFFVVLKHGLMNFGFLEKFSEKSSELSPVVELAGTTDHLQICYLLVFVNSFVDRGVLHHSGF
jgi:hypothetical protein